MEGQEPPGPFMVGRGVRAEERDDASCRTGDIGGRAAGHRVFGYQVLAGTGPGSQGPQGRARSPWQGALALAQVPGPKVGAECHRSCWRSVLHTLSWGKGGNVPNMASVQRASRKQRVQAASRAGAPAGDNLFHGSYAYGTAPASESTRTFPRNKQ